MNKILNTKINRNIINIIQLYNLPSLNVVRENNNLKMGELKIEIDVLKQRLNYQDCYDENWNYYTNLYDTKIVHRNLILNMKSQPYWTFRKKISYPKYETPIISI